MCFSRLDIETLPSKVFSKLSLKRTLFLLLLKNLNPRQLTDNETSLWPLISCLGVTWVSPWPRPFKSYKQSWVHLFLWKKWTWSQIMTNSFAPSSPRYRLDTFFTRHISSEHSDIKMSFFRLTNQEKMNFVETCLCLSNTLSWDVGTELKGKNYITRILCDAKSICFNPFTRRYNPSRQGGGMVVPDRVHSVYTISHHWHSAEWEHVKMIRFARLDFFVRPTGRQLFPVEVSK